MKKILLILIANIFLHTYAQEQQKELVFDDFMRLVLLNNFDLVVEKHEVSIAEAALVAARVFEDPELEVILPTFDRDEFAGLPRNLAFELEVPIELFGKRRNRIGQARAELTAARFGLEDFLRELRGEAASLFIEIAILQQKIERMNQNLEQLRLLENANQVLFEVGEIGEIDLIQTRLEGLNFQTEIFDARAEMQELLMEAQIVAGIGFLKEVSFVVDLSKILPVRNLDDLISLSNDRPDIKQARSIVEASNMAMRLERANRLPDINIIAGYHNESALRPGPGFSAAYVGLRIPIKISGLNRGALNEARITLDQSETLLAKQVLVANAETKAAWEKYQLHMQKRSVFSERIISDAEKVREAIVFSYQRGNVSLLEVLDAQRTLNETYMNYYDTMQQYFQSVVELSTVSGIWMVGL